MDENDYNRSLRARNIGIAIFAGVSAVVFAIRIAMELSQRTLDQDGEFMLFVSILGTLISLIGLTVLLVKLRRS